MRVKVLLAAALLLAGNAWSQIADLDPDWKELEIAPPPHFSVDRLVPIDMPRYVTVKVGIDPDSLSIGTDGIVRYVVVAVSQSGNVNAMFEGIWCLKGEVKTYARYGSDGKWRPVDDAQWLALNGNQRSMHALALARQGACDGRAATAGSPAEIVRKLKQSRLDGIQR
ncbi:MAG: CNP1-like family protein [Burkholderiaceae bacterium]